MAFYMKIDGIEGAVTETNRKGWIPLTSFDLDVARRVPMVVGSNQDRNTQRPQFSEITATKKVDTSSPLLFIKTCAKSVGDIIVEACAPDNNNTAYYQVKLNDAMISRYQTSGYLSAGQVGHELRETIRLAYTKLEVVFIHPEQSPISACYDLAQATVA